MCMLTYLKMVLQKNYLWLVKLLIGKCSLIIHPVYADNHYKVYNLPLPFAVSRVHNICVGESV